MIIDGEEVPDINTDFKGGIIWALRQHNQIVGTHNRILTEMTTLMQVLEARVAALEEKTTGLNKLD